MSKKKLQRCVWCGGTNIHKWKDGKTILLSCVGHKFNCELMKHNKKSFDSAKK